MTFTDPSPPAAAAPATPEEAAPAKSRARPKSRNIAVPPAIRTRLVPNCAWPTEADTLPTRRGKKR